MFSPIPFSSSDDAPGSLGNSSPFHTFDSDDDAPGKGTRTCTDHPLSKFVSYPCLSPSYKDFVSTLASIFVLNHVYEVLFDPKWNSAMVEVMKILNGTS